MRTGNLTVAGPSCTSATDSGAAPRSWSSRGGLDEWSKLDDWERFVVVAEGTGVVLLFVLCVLFVLSRG